MDFKNILNRIPDMLLAQLACFSMVYGLTSSLGLPYPPVRILLLSVSFIFILSVAFFNRKTSVVSSIILGSGLVPAVFYAVSRLGITYIGEFVNDYFYWLDSYIQSPYYAYYKPLYQKITVIALVVLISVFSYLFTIKKFNFYIIAGAGIGIFTVQSSYGLMSNYTPFYLFLLAVFLFYIKYVYIREAAKRAISPEGSGTAALWGIPLCIVIIGSASMFHKNDEPIEWKWMDNKVNQVYNYFKDRFDYQTFDYFSFSATSGFGDGDNILGGSVKRDRTDVLRVDTENNVYLKGATKDIYTGSRWTSSPPEKDASYNLYDDTEEMLSGMKLLTGSDDFLDEYFYTDKITVTFMNLKTKSVFLPSKAYAFKPLKDGFSGTTGSMGDMYSDKRLSKGFQYDVDLYAPKMGTEEFADALRESRRGLYRSRLLSGRLRGSRLEFAAEDNASDSDDALYRSGINISISGDAADLIRKSEGIYDQFLQLPDTLPQDVRDLSAELTAQYDNNYDKAMAIEQFLSSNYEYNLDVRPTPRDRDFVEYFLFDLKEGYCTYYATAMAVLARCAGIPARYAEGYILPSEPISGSPSSYIVTNMQAHAWVELYFEGYGWLPFEPTAPFSAGFYESRETGGVLAGSNSSDYNEYMESTKGYNGESNPDYNNIEEAGTDHASPAWNILLPVLGIGLIGVLLALLISINAFRHRLKLYKLFNLPAKKCILLLYKYYISVLGLRKLAVKPGETPSLYGERVDSIMYFNPTKFRALSSIFVKARYSAMETSDKEKQVFVDFHPVFQKAVKSDMGKFNYFLQKYILGKF